MPTPIRQFILPQGGWPAIDGVAIQPFFDHLIGTRLAGKRQGANVINDAKAMVNLYKATYPTMTVGQAYQRIMKALAPAYGMTNQELYRLSPRTGLGNALPQQMNALPAVGIDLARARTRRAAATPGKAAAAGAKVAGSLAVRKISTKKPGTATTKTTVGMGDLRKAEASPAHVAATKTTPAGKPGQAKTIVNVSSTPPLTSLFPGAGAQSTTTLIPSMYENVPGSVKPIPKTILAKMPQDMSYLGLLHPGEEIPPLFTGHGKEAARNLKSLPKSTFSQAITEARLADITAPSIARQYLEAIPLLGPVLATHRQNPSRRAVEEGKITPPDISNPTGRMMAEAMVETEKSLMAAAKAGGWVPPKGALPLLGYTLSTIAKGAVSPLGLGEYVPGHPTAAAAIEQPVMIAIFHSFSPMAEAGALRLTEEITDPLKRQAMLRIIQPQLQMQMMNTFVQTSHGLGTGKPGEIPGAILKSAPLASLIAAIPGGKSAPAQFARTTGEIGVGLPVLTAAGYAKTPKEGVEMVKEQLPSSIPFGVAMGGLGLAGNRRPGTVSPEATASDIPPVTGKTAGTVSPPATFETTFRLNARLREGGLNAPESSYWANELTDINNAAVRASSVSKNTATQRAAKHQPGGYVPDPTKTGNLLPGKARPGYETLGNAITPVQAIEELAIKQQIGLHGQSVKSPSDLGAIAMIYRNPRFETFRFIAVDDTGTIVFETGLTSKMPKGALVFPHRPGANIDCECNQWYNTLGAAMQREGATHYYLIHNHPSGDVTPSMDDTTITNRFEHKLPGFAGHIIIDHYRISYATAGRSFNWFLWEKDQVVGDTQLPDILLTPSLKHPLLGKEINTADQFVQYAQSVVAPDKIIMIYTSSNKICGIEPMSFADFRNITIAKQWIFNRLRTFGSSKANAIFSPNNTEQASDFQQAAIALMDANILFDGVSIPAGNKASVMSDMYEKPYTGPVDYNNLTNRVIRVGSGLDPIHMRMLVEYGRKVQAQGGGHLNYNTWAQNMESRFGSHATAIRPYLNQVWILLQDGIH